MRDRYSILVGALFGAVILVAVLNTLGDNGGTLGLDQMPRRWPLPEFAVPAAAGELEGDANVARGACRVHAPEAIRVCGFFDRPLVLSFWFGTGECADQQDVVDRVYRRYRGRVGFLSLDVRGDRDTVRDLVREHGWRMPVGYDRDGAVATLYRVGGCPTFAYAYPGGVLWSAGVGELTAAELEARVRALLRATRAAQGSP